MSTNKNRAIGAEAIGNEAKKELSRAKLLYDEDVRSGDADAHDYVSPRAIVCLCELFSIQTQSPDDRREREIPLESRGGRRRELSEAVRTSLSLALFHAGEAQRDASKLLVAALIQSWETSIGFSGVRGGFCTQPIELLSSFVKTRGRREGDGRPTRKKEIVYRPFRESVES